MRLNTKALTFDDVLLEPNFSNVLPKDVSLTTSLTKNIKLNLPLLSAAMDTVTESKLAIALAQEGGLGILHKNLSPKDQAAHVKSVKRFESGIVNEPITVDESSSVKQVIEMAKEFSISGFPVLKNNKIVGIVTNRDFRFETNLSQKISNIMTPRKKLITVLDTDNRTKAIRLLHKHRLERVLVTNEKFELKGLITVKDILKSTEHPNASKDKLGRLLVGAAIGVAKDADKRIPLLIDAGVDVIVIDTAHGHSKRVLDTIKKIKKNFPAIDLIAGNIATTDAAKALVDCGVDAIKVGIGPGSICTTRIVTGVGIPQITAIENVAKITLNSKVSLIADGGIRYSGDIAKALAAGSDSVMLGSIFSGTEEAPGEIELYQGRSYKSYRGMGSISAMKKGSAERYFQDAELGDDKLVPEGVEGRVPYKGSVVNLIHQMMGGLRAAMGYLGCKSIAELKANATFVEISNSGIKESHVHDVGIVKEAPNYRVE